MSAWRFSSEVSRERRAALSQAPSFAEIIDLLARDMTVLCCHGQGCDEMSGFSRAVFNLAVSRPSFDLFFNSEHGYRGEYFKSPHVGLAANERCIEHLAPALLAWSKQHEPTVEHGFAEASLSSPTAKVWLIEVETHQCTKCIGEWGNPKSDTPEIINGRWEVGSSPGCRSGRMAPFLTKLRVFGAFLNERYDEFTPARKRHRARDINARGWS